MSGKNVSILTIRAGFRSHHGQFIIIAWEDDHTVSTIRNCLNPIPHFHSSHRWLCFAQTQKSL